MTSNELYEQYRNGARPVVRFTSGIEDYESFDPNMKAQLISMYDCGDSFCILFDFSQFEEYNKTIEVPNWNDSNGFLVKWSESPFYPKNKTETIYIGYDCEVCFVLEELPQAYLDYKESGTKMSYINWLEEQYLLLKGK